MGVSYERGTPVGQSQGCTRSRALTLFTTRNARPGRPLRLVLSDTNVPAPLTMRPPSSCCRSTLTLSQDEPPSNPKPLTGRAALARPAAPAASQGLSGGSGGAPPQLVSSGTTHSTSLMNSVISNRSTPEVPAEATAASALQAGPGQVNE